ncbi:hypothetical protein D9M69_377370 [compost metagenome]
MPARALVVQDRWAGQRAADPCRAAGAGGRRADAPAPGRPAGAGGGSPRAPRCPAQPARAELPPGQPGPPRPAAPRAPGRAQAGLRGPAGPERHPRTALAAPVQQRRGEDPRGRSQPRPATGATGPGHPAGALRRHSRADQRRAGRGGDALATGHPHAAGGGPDRRPVPLCGCAHRRSGCRPGAARHAGAHHPGRLPWAQFRGPGEPHRALRA